MQKLAENWPLILAFLYAAANLANGMISNPEAKSLIAKGIDLISFLTRSGAQGTLKVPLLHSSQAPSAIAQPDGASLRLLPLVLIPLLMLSACATMKGIGINLAQCAIGQVPSAVAGIVPDVEAVLGGEAVDWQSQLAAIGARAGTDALACAIKSIVGQLAGKKASLDDVGRRKVERGQIYLNARGL